MHGNLTSKSIQIPLARRINEKTNRNIIVMNYKIQPLVYKFPFLKDPNILPKTNRSAIAYLSSNIIMSNLIPTMNYTPPEVCSSFLWVNLRKNILPSFIFASHNPHLKIIWFCTHVLGRLHKERFVHMTQHSQTKTTTFLRGAYGFPTHPVNFPTVI